MIPDIFMGLEPAQAEAEIHHQIFTRGAATDHTAKVARVTRALHYLGDPQDSLRVIHVTGTNGKTSTSRMIESLLRAQGLRTGLFTSPHITTLRERIVIGGQPLAREDLVRLWQYIAPAIHRTDLYSSRIGGPRMSFFEVLTVLGLVAFAQQRVDVAVVEVGIGGARDATVVCDAAVAVLTPIDWDHEGYFTGGVEGVAKEKSGIIKDGSVVVTAAQVEDAAGPIAQRARRTRSTVLAQGSAFDARDRRVVPGGQQVTVETYAGTYADVYLPLNGLFQVQNAAVALQAVESFLGRGALDVGAVRAGFAAATSPGRLEVVATDPTVVVDAAHNPHGVGALMDSLQETFAFSRIIAVVAALADKDHLGMLTSLAPVVDEVIITQTESARATPVEELAQEAAEILGAHRVRWTPAPGQALSWARTAAAADQADPGAVLVVGSITLIGAIREALAAEHEGASLPETAL